MGKLIVKKVCRTPHLNEFFEWGFEFEVFSRKRWVKRRVVEVLNGRIKVEGKEPYSHQYTIEALHRKIQDKEVRHRATLKELGLRESQRLKLEYTY